MMNDPIALTFNRREIIIPFFRVGVPTPDLASIWREFRDFRTAR